MIPAYGCISKISRWLGPGNWSLLLPSLNNSIGKNITFTTIKTKLVMFHQTGSEFSPVECLLGIKFTSRTYIWNITKEAGKNVQFLVPH